MSLSNLQLAELLARAAEGLEGNKAKASRRAARASLFWLEEVGDVAAAGRPLTELGAVGPWLSNVITAWLEDPPELIPDPPLLRTGFNTIARARRLLEEHEDYASRLRGDLQMHSVDSDGGGTIEEMASEARDRGYDYIAITDHSVGLKIAGGMSEEAFHQQHRGISTLNKALARESSKLKVLRGIELNISPDGSGDMPPESLLSMDIVLGSFHSKLRLKEDQTERYLAALRNPAVHVLGHPRGRVYNFRAGLSADWPRVFAEAAALDKAVEVDSYPDRQDLDLDLLSLAVREGCRISLGTDAHSPWQLYFIDIGLAACIEAGVAPERVLNFMPADALLDWTGGHKERYRSTLS